MWRWPWAWTSWPWATPTPSTTPWLNPSVQKAFVTAKEELVMIDVSSKFSKQENERSITNRQYESGKQGIGKLNEKRKDKERRKELRINVIHGISEMGQFGRLALSPSPNCPTFSLLSVIYNALGSPSLWDTRGKICSKGLSQEIVWVENIRNMHLCSVFGLTEFKTLLISSRMKY